MLVPFLLSFRKGEVTYFFFTFTHISKVELVIMIAESISKWKSSGTIFSETDATPHSG